LSATRLHALLQTEITDWFYHAIVVRFYAEGPIGGAFASTGCVTVTVAQAGSRPAARQPVADERGASSSLPAERRDNAKRRRRRAADARPPRANDDMDRWTRPERGHGGPN